MLEWSALSLFVVAALALLLTPGPAVLYIVTRSIDQGRLAGIVSVLGVNVGSLFHVFGASLGLSAILVSSALAYNVVKYIGAAYLIYLGIQKLREKSQLEQVEIEPQKLSRIFSQGVIVNILNPKTALFFFAFLPQFVNPERGSVPLQTLMLGGLFVLMALCTDGTYAILSGTAGKWIKGNAKFMRRQKYFTGGTYIALGLTAALAGHRSK